MCLAVPMKVEKIEGAIATVESGGMEMQVDISLTPDVKVGEYVIVHAGFAIEKLKTDEAEETLKMIAEVVGVMDEDRG